MEEYLPQYTQLLGLGLLWVTVHCSGMCGPIVGSLVATQSGAHGPGEADASWFTQLRQRAGNVLAYQGGRALTYALIGAAAGLAGAAAEAFIGPLTKVAGLLVAVALVGAGLLRIEPVAKRLKLPSGSSTSSATGKFLGNVMRRVRRLAPRRGPMQMMLIGAVMGLLPCMLMFWVLGLSASTASPLHGALIMVGLVALTTPVLLFAGTAPLVCKPAVRQLGEKIIPYAIILSGLWLGLISAAANGWIDHLHVPFELFGEKLVIMFW
ncbi:sulfite exporter TauE/SafE family protein [Persicimonas caeni]|uniref:Sulfite exporter TauE/SafE family protein n=1 Tax=Persicimonas caeni TaxID=2292766 RepID=A0A4Y6PZC7_PERCE|nr:sulfite exporter TauE/SafE family protein [Persicimonas caeni]QDG53678.1 sulfite exporter TauE/SafE family protein [Persicimonas caeni]QED34899.1 sulfite exporter TauE/SafE family protein [Persicimonas caeni]